MKPFPCILLAAGLLSTASLTAIAQTQKGQTITSGTVNLSLSRQRSGSDNQTTFRATSAAGGFSVNRGAFFKDNWLIGYSLGISYSRSVFSNTSGSRPLPQDDVVEALGTSAGLFLRRYWPVVDRLSVYAGGGLSGSRESTSLDIINPPPGTTQPTNGRIIGWRVAPVGQVGALYALTNRIGLEASVSTNGFPVSVGSASFGVTILGGRTRQPNAASDGFEAPQTQQGRWIFGVSADVAGNGQSGALTYLSQQSTNSTATASLSVGRFVKTNRLVGLALNYTASRSGGGDTPGAPTYSLTVIPFVRSYVGTYRLRPFVEGRAGYGFTKSPQSVNAQRQLNASVGAGLAYMVGDRFIIQTTLGTLGGTYNWTANLPEGTSQSAYSIEARGSTLSNFAVLYSL